MPDGSKGFIFTGNSLSRVYQAEIQTQSQIESLNQQYYFIYIRNNNYTLLPTATLQNKDFDKLIQEFSLWSENEVINGETAKIYSTADGLYYNLLIGESYVRLKQWENTIALERAALNNLSNDLIEKDIVEIQRVDKTSLPVFLDIGVFPYYRSDLNLSTYEDNINLYVLNSQTHKIIEISPKQLPSVSEGNAQELEQQARELIALIAPEVNLDLLITAHGEK